MAPMDPSAPDPAPHGSASGPSPQPPAGVPPGVPPGLAAELPAGLWSSAGYLSLARGVAVAATAVSWIVTARVLPEEDFGRWTFLLAGLALVEAVTDGGTGAAVLQRGGEGPGAFAAAWQAALRLRRWTALAGSLLLAGLGLWVGAAPGWLLLACVLPLSRLPETAALVLQRELAWGPVVAARCLGSVARGVLVPALALGGQTEIGLLLAAHAGGLALGNVLAHVAVRSRGLLPRNSAATRGLWRLALPLGCAALTHQAALTADNWILRLLRGDAELGVYNAAARIGSVLLLLASNLGLAALPWLSGARAEGRLAAATGRLSAVLALPSAVGLGLLLPHAGALLGALFGTRFEAGAPALQVLLVSSLVVHATTGWLTAVLAVGAARTLLAWMAAALALNVLANLALVPGLGGTGAALATLGTELLLSAAAWRTLSALDEAPVLPRTLWGRALIAFLAAALLSALARPLLFA